MELTQGAQEGGRLAQERGGEQIALGSESRALQFGILTLAHDPKHPLLRLLQIVEEDPFELAATVGVRGGFLQLPHRQRQVTLQDLLPERRGAAEKAVRQTFDLTHAQRVAAEGADELVQVGGADAL
jgi:hypothetical protein